MFARLPACLLRHHTWLVLACPLQLRKLLDQVFNADVFHVLLKFLMNLQNRVFFHSITQINRNSFPNVFFFFKLPASVWPTCPTWTCVSSIEWE